MTNFEQPKSTGLLRSLLLLVLILFGFWVLNDQGLVAIVLEGDKSHISKAILILWVIASVYWIYISRNIYLEKSIKQLMENQGEMKVQISDLKRELLNPRTGVVVETIKNTEFRKRIEERGDLGLDLLTEHKELIKWKNNINKAFWLMLTTVLGILAFLVTNNM